MRRQAISLALALLAGGTARAEEGAAAPAAVAVEPPQLVQESPARYPEAIADQGVSGVVKLRIVVDESGAVGTVEIVERVHPELDLAAAEAAKGLRFQAATMDGKPVPVVIEYEYRFVARPKVEAPAAPRPSAIVRGQVRSKGTRDPVPGANLVLADGTTGSTDGDGRFSLAVPEGEQVVEVSAPGFEAGKFHEKLKRGDELEVIYSLDPLRLRPYETIVHGERERTEVSRVTLSQEELREVPGTMGDPFRAVMLLPGVSSVLSGVSYPVVRGASPASTGYYLDGIRVPILFHLFLGPAVVHPDFIDAIDFYPGTPPAQFGRQLGGVIDGRTAQPKDDRIHASAYLDLLNAGGFVQAPVKSTGTSITLAGRISYSSLLLAPLANRLQPDPLPGYSNPSFVLNFWDYQGRLEQQVGAGRVRLFAFGSSDLVGSESPDPRVTAATESVLFHRGDLRYQLPLKDGQFEVGATVGIDTLAFASQGLDQPKSRFGFDEKSWGARTNWTDQLGKGLTLSLGADFDHRAVNVAITAGSRGAAAQFNEPLAVGTFGGAFAQLLYKSPGEMWTVIPGFRLDAYRLDPDVSELAPEPRLTVRCKLGDTFSLKGGAGVYHQQPTTLVQLPVADVAGLRYGLQRGAQVDFGAEWKALSSLHLSLDVYFSRLFQTLEFNPFDPEQMRNLTPQPFDKTSLSDPNSVLRASDFASDGYAYGFEVLLRHPLGGNWFGWLSYSLQRSVRYAHYDLYDAHDNYLGRGEGYLPYAFDQTHVVNAVLSYRFQRWTVGGVLHFNTGRPETGIMTSSTMVEGTDDQGRPMWVRVGNQNADRLPPFLRFDVRIARSFAFDDFMLDAYLDVLNTTFSSEVISFEYLGGVYGGGGQLRRTAQGLPITLPILGVKASY